MYYTTNLFDLEDIKSCLAKKQPARPPDAGRCKINVDFKGKKGYDWREVIVLRWLDQKVERFCWNHPRFGIPRLMLFIVGGNLLVWLAAMMDTTGTLVGLLSFDPAAFCHGQIWRLVTFVFVPNSSGMLWLAISLYFYYFIGSTLEQAWGPGRFTIYYLTGMALTCLFSLVYYWITGFPVPVTSGYYLNMSLFFAFATLWPDQMVLLFFFIPVKMKWLAWADVALFAVDFIRLLTSARGPLFTWGLGLALIPVMAVANYLLFCGQWLFDMLRPGHIQGRTRQKVKTIRFKQAAKKTQAQQKAQGYTRKCAVCGITDRDHPEMEFRYCSRCAGYHCFCMDHINDHIHFTE